MQREPLSTDTGPARSAGRALPETNGNVIVLDATTGGTDDDDSDPESEQVDALEALFERGSGKGKGKVKGKGNGGKGTNSEEEAPEEDEDEVQDEEDEDPDTTPAEDEEEDDEGLAPPKDEDDEEEEEEEGEEKDDDAEKLALPEKFQGRLDKLVKQRNQAREELGTYKTKVETLTSQVAAFEAEPVMLSPEPEHPLSNARTAAEVEASEKEWQRVQAWCEENDEGGTFTAPDGTKTDLDKKQIKKLLKHAESILKDHVPARREYLAQREKFAPETKKAYPWMTNGEHPGTKFAAGLVQGTKLALRADYELTAADAYVGRMIRKGLGTAVLDSKTGAVKLMRAVKQKAAGKSDERQLVPAGGKKRPPVRAEAGGVAVRPAGKAGRGMSVQAALSRGDGEDALAALYGG